MAGYLPKRWTGKRVLVRFGGRERAGFEAWLGGENAGGLFIEIREEEGVRTAFVPWTAVRYVELLEPAESGPGVRVTEKPPGF